MGRASILVVAATLFAGIGCGSNDSSDDPPSARSCETQSPGGQAPTDAGAARKAAIDYFLTCDPAACTEDATENHVRSDYGTLAQCERVRESNRLTRKDLAFARSAELSGTEAKVRGRVLATGQTFVVRLKKIGGHWKIDRIRGSL